YVRAGFVVIPVVARRVLEIPIHLAGVGIPGDHAVGVEVVAGAVAGVEHGDRIAGAPDHLVGLDVVGAGHPHGPAAGLPGDLILVLPGLAAGLAGRRDHVFAPDHLAGGAVERRDEVAHAAVAPGGTDDDLVPNRERRGGELQIRLAIGQVRFPHDLSVVFVGGDDARRVVGAGNHQIAPERGAAVRERQ